MTMTLEEMKAKAIALRAEAAANYAEREASFERSDTDGFLSQWASGVNASLRLAQAEILESGGTASFPGLFLPTGERVKARIIDTKYGRCWAVLTENGTFARFVALAPACAIELAPATPEEKKLHGSEWKRLERWKKKHGFVQKPEEASALARLRSNGRGLSGNVWVSVERTDGGFPPGAVIVV